MKIEMIKQHGGVLLPVDDIASDQMKKFKSGEQYQIEIKRARNPHFHRKVYAFFNFCFEHWDGVEAYTEHMSPAVQMDRFRKDLIILAGYYESSVRLNGDTRIEAKSISYAAMSQDDFENFYHALVNAALKHIFHRMNDRKLSAELLAFF